MTPTQQRLLAVRAQLPDDVQLVAVSKFHSAEAIRECYAAGQRVFGESREQELRSKVPALPPDIEWHFIGHLQTNKVRHVVPYISLIQAVDSLRLLQEINRQAAIHGRCIRVLLEVHVAQEDTKYGLTPTALKDLLAGGEWRELHNVSICGLMCMASNTPDTTRIRRDFRTARLLFDEVKDTFFAADDNFCIRSWGMTSDYPLAIQEGATMVRVGTAIFGERQ